MKSTITSRFELIRVLRDERTSKTFVATDHLLRQPEVLVKTICKDQFTYDEHHLTEFFSWSKAVKHPQLAEVLDAGLTPRQDLYYVRQYLRASESVSRGDMLPVGSLLSVVGFLHSKGRVHGAIKPSNVFVDVGSVKLADPEIGLLRSRLVTDEDIRFSAPEVLRGSKPTFESDLYSVGALLYRFLSGQDLFADIDLERLKSKYIWASPRPLIALCHVPQSLSDLVDQLLDKNPAKRLPAFTSLTTALQVASNPPTRAPLFGRESQMRIVERILKTADSGLRALLIESEPGLGKTRLVEEIRTRHAFRPIVFMVGQCSGSSQPLEPLLQALRPVFKEQGELRESRLKAALGDFWPSLSVYFLNSEKGIVHSEQGHLFEKTVSDFTGFVASLARRGSTVLVIEDINQVDPATEHFLRSLFFRATEIPLTLILTQRTDGLSSKLIDSMSAALRDHFERVCLESLTGAECQSVVRFFEVPDEQQQSVLRMSAGNPLLIEEYSRFRNLPSPEPPRVRESISWILSKLPESSRFLCELLSIFDRPVDFELLGKFGFPDPTVLKQTLEDLGRIGLTEISQSGIRMKYPAAKTRMYETIPVSRRRHFHRLVSKIFQETVIDPEMIDPEMFAFHLFEAGNWNDAAVQYLRFANQKYEQNNYNAAGCFYEKARQCAKHGRFELAPADRMKLADSYRLTGKQALARGLYEDLISSVLVRKDPELIASAFGSLALTFDKKAALDRTRLVRLAIECLPNDSPQLSLRYCQLCTALLRTGDFIGAAGALEQAEVRIPSNDKNLQMLKQVRASFLINTANFKGAVECLEADVANEKLGVRLNNLALCLENLGKLRRAREIQLEAMATAETNSFLPIQVLSLVNLGSIQTKLGNLSAADKLFAKALGWLDRLHHLDREFNTKAFVSAYSDAALHAIHVGKYQSAVEYLGKTRAGIGLAFELDHIFIGVTQCEFYIQVGETKKVTQLLVKLRNSPTFKCDYFQVEKTLIEAHLIDEPMPKTVSSLERALATSEKLETLYQQCKVLNELAAAHFSLNTMQEARTYAKRSLRFARSHGFRLLETRALLLAGRTAEKPREKQHWLFAAFQMASEIGLPELVAESAYYIALWQMDSGDFVAAREYLIRSVSITGNLAEGIPAAWRPRYLAKAWRRSARKALESCNQQTQSDSLMTFHDRYKGEDRYFRAAYRLTISAGTAKDFEVFVTSLLKTLETALPRPAVIIVRDSQREIIRAVRTKPSEDLIARIKSLGEKAKNRIYFGSPDKTQTKDTVAWIPLRTHQYSGGIYVSCRHGESALSEKEIEFLTILGTIANSGLALVGDRSMEAPKSTPLTEFQGIIGASKLIRDVYSQIEIAAGNSATVLVEGESGTGKELVARAIHQTSHRAKLPFIAVDCGAIPEGLIEAELFGAKKGSYTGAFADRTGLFETANHGTIFLDEISNTSLAVQAKLLRVLQEREVRRIGESRGRSIDVRLIAATNCNLERLVQEGKFRQDLVYRLKVLHIKVPPLRSRREDIPMLAQTFLNRLNTTHKSKKHFAADTIDGISNYNFPGNVRELQNTIERAFFSARGVLISDIPVESYSSTQPASPDEVHSWFRDLTEGRKDFWSAVHDRYKHRDISREKVVALVDLGLKSTRGSYTTMAAMFRLKEKEYRRFMDFLRRNSCLLDFRPYRKPAAAQP